MEKITTIKEYELIPNTSLGRFIVGDNIKNYLNLSYMVEKVNEEEYQYESYDFIDFEVSVWVENDHIRTIRCDKFCFFRQQNLIKMKYQDFLSLSGIYPDSSENIYLLVNNRGQNQKVHTFERSGLQIWVWRNKIVTVLISNYQLEEFYS